MTDGLNRRGAEDAEPCLRKTLSVLCGSAVQYQISYDGALETFDYRFEVAAPLEAVVAFHGRTDVLRRLTPPPLLVQVHRFGEMKEGMEADFTLWLGPIPIHWHAVHQQVGANGFTDIQKTGPVASWRHTHRFTALGPDRTGVHEHIEYRHKPGLAGLLSRLLFPKAGLRLIFTYRKWITRKALEGL